MSRAGADVIVEAPPRTDRGETFAQYLARHYIEHRQFCRSTLQETTALERVCDIVLVRTQGPRLAIVCIVDLEAQPHRLVDLTWQTLAEVADRCKRSSHGNDTPLVTFELLEIGCEAPQRSDCERLHLLSRQMTLANASLIGWRLDTVSGTAWTSTRSAGIVLGRYGMERLMRRARQRIPVITIGLLLSCAVMFAYELRLGVSPWSRSFAANADVLASLGALEKTLVVEKGEWWRLLSAAFLHANALHLAFNSLCLYLSGTSLERLLGRRWLLALFIASAVCGSVLSLALNPPSVLSVGASGGIMGLLAVAGVCSFRYPRGSAVRRRLQTLALSLLLPSLIPFGSSFGGLRIDLAGHVGGALCGAMAGLLLFKTWPLTSQRPRYPYVATAICIVGACVMLAGLAAMG